VIGRAEDYVRIGGELRVGDGLVVGGDSTRLNSDVTTVNGNLKLDSVLPAAGAPLCLIASTKVVSTCLASVAGSSESQAQLERLQDQVKQQQIIIDSLRRIVCLQNPEADVCKEQK
jgi:hypothetical protein